MSARLVGLLLVVSFVVHCCCVGVHQGEESGGQIVDGQAAPVYRINLDLAPEHRWNQVIDDYKDGIWKVYKLFVDMIPPKERPIVLAIADRIGEKIEEHLGNEFGAEIRAAAKRSGLPLGAFTLLQFSYELSAACTSIIAQTNEGTILHARNLDFGKQIANFPALLRTLTIHVQFTRGTGIAFEGVTYAGYVGLLTAMKQGYYSITVDETLGAYWHIILNVLTYMEENRNHAKAISFLVREIVNSSLEYSDAVHSLALTHLIAPVYYIIGGTKPDEGAVITRERAFPLNVWRLDSESGRWFEVETNYRHWKPVPPDDDRRDVAIKAMNEMGRNNLTLNGLYEVLSIQPVVNNGTTYTALMHPSTDEFKAYIRNVM